jgi:peptidylprolyl isomerase
MTARTLSALLLACLIAVGACAPGDPLPLDRDVPQAPSRARDGLLEHADLQAVAEATVARDPATLRVALTSSNPAIRARAAFGLGSIRTLGAGPALASLLDDADPGVRADVAFALGQLPQLGGAEEQLVARLRVEEVRAVRDELIDAMGRGARPPGVQILMGLDGDDLPAATRAVARAFVDGPRPAGILDTLVHRLGHPDARARRYAAWALGREDDVVTWIDERVPIRNALAEMAPDDPAAMHLVQALGRRADPASAARIVERYRVATDWRVRSNAVAALELQSGDPAARQTLAAALADPAPLVRLRAAQVVAAVQMSPALLERVEARVRDGDEDLAVVGPLLAALLPTSRRAVVSAWLAAMDRDDLPRWRVAEGLLARMDPRRAVQIARRGLASTDPRVARIAARVVARSGERLGEPTGPSDAYLTEVVEGLAAALVAGDPETVATLVSALGRDELVRAGSVDVLDRRLADLPPGALRRAVADALDEASSPVARGLPRRWGWPASRATADATVEIPAIDFSFLRELGPRPRLVLDTPRGRIVAVLDAESAPLTVQTLARVANAGRLDGVPFHRVIPNFVAQGGDLGRVGDDLGHPMRTEITRIRFGEAADGAERVVGMARTASFDTESTQFFITHSMQPHLDGEYTAFGTVVEGATVVDRILPEDLLLRARVVPGTFLLTGS